MNPQDLGGMVWMGQFTSPADRTIMLDDNLATFYNQQPAIDDITQQTHTMVILICWNKKEKSLQGYYFTNLLKLFWCNGF